MRDAPSSFLVRAASLVLTLALWLDPLPSHAQGVPGVDPNKCLAGKNKCVAKKIAGLLTCREKCQKSPTKCGQAQTDCEAKVIAKFDGGATPAKGCFAKLEAKDDPAKPDTVCTTTGDTAAMETRADGAVDDLLAALEGGAACGNGVAEGAESCDGADLDGLDCTDFGFTASAGLVCTAACTFDLSGCKTASNVPAIAGAGSAHFHDNGDGTATDPRTGLMWEVKTGTVTGVVFCPDLATCPDPHDVNNRYTWSASFSAFDGSAKTAFLDVLNDVAGGGASCFAGHCDWRLASLPELKGILLEPESGGGCSTSPCIDASFPGPTTVASYYWSSTTDAVTPDGAWAVYFGNGSVDSNGFESNDLHLRAVRGGL